MKLCISILNENYPKYSFSIPHGYISNPLFITTLCSVKNTKIAAYEQPLTTTVLMINIVRKDIANEPKCKHGIRMVFLGSIKRINR